MTQDNEGNISFFHKGSKRKAVRVLQTIHNESGATFDYINIEYLHFHKYFVKARYVCSSEQLEKLLASIKELNK